LLNDNKDNENKIPVEKESEYDSFLSINIPETETQQNVIFGAKQQYEPVNRSSKAERILMCILAFFIPFVGLIVGIVFLFESERRELGKSMLISSAIGWGLSILLLSILTNPNTFNFNL